MSYTECAGCGLRPDDLPNGFGFQEEPETFFIRIGGRDYCFGCADDVEEDELDWREEDDYDY